MGDRYDFEIRVIDGIEVSGFTYQCNESKWQEVFVEMSQEQIDFANSIQIELEEINNKIDVEVRTWAVNHLSKGL